MTDSPVITQLPLSDSFTRRRLEEFLSREGLRYEAVDEYLALTDPDTGEILAGGGLKGDLIKCVAVSSAARSANLSGRLVSELISLAARNGHPCVKVFTKPGNEAVFASMGFRVLARAAEAILMENGRGLGSYLEYLRRESGTRVETVAQAQPARTGVIVMNANPFTLGHRYLVESAASQVDRLFVIPVKEDVSAFTYAERRAMIEAGCAGLAGVTVLEGSDYAISETTFPTYFLKDPSHASGTQMALDIDLFCNHIAPALGAGVRFVGSEPRDPLTRAYNSALRRTLPGFGLVLSEIPRLKSADGRFITASRVRSLLDGGRLAHCLRLTPVSTHPYLLAYLADRALRLELDAPLKPGLVCPGSKGAHGDMDYGVMLRGIEAIRPFWAAMVMADSAGELRRAGIAAEKAMLASTGGVNTHKGAIFALGVALYAAGKVLLSPGPDPESEYRRIANLLAEKGFHPTRMRMSAVISEFAAGMEPDSDSHGGRIAREYGVKGALQMAREGYRDIFRDWLPYYDSIRKEPYALQRTLVALIAAIDDTCLIHRVGYARSEELRDEAADIFGRVARDADPAETEKILTSLCGLYASEHASPGGAADMLALIIFIQSINI